MTSSGFASGRGRSLGRWTGDVDLVILVLAEQTNFDFVTTLDMSLPTSKKP